MCLPCGAWSLPVPSLCHAVPSSPPRHPPLLGNGHCSDGATPALYQGGSQGGRGPDAGTAISLSYRHPAVSLTMAPTTVLSSLPPPPSQSQARVGFAVTLDVHALSGPGPRPVLSWQQAGRPGCQRWHWGRQARPRPRCPPLLPQLVTASLLEPGRCSIPSLCHRPSAPRKGKRAPSELVLPPDPAGSRVVCPGAAEHIHRCRPPLPVHTLSPCSLICLFMLGFTRVTMIVKRKKKKGRMYLEMLVKRFLTRPRGSPRCLSPHRGDSDPEGPCGSPS